MSTLVALVSAQPAASTGVAAWAGAAAATAALPSAVSVRSLRRQAALLTWLVTGGLASFAMALLGPARGAISSLQAVLLAAPAGITALTTLPLLNGLRATARTFAPAPAAPTPPILRALSAHPLVAIPVQVTALAAVLGTLQVAGTLGLPRPLAGPVSILIAAGLAIALFDGLRYRRLRASATRATVGPAPAPAGLAGAAPGGRPVVLSSPTRR